MDKSLIQKILINSVGLILRPILKLWMDKGLSFNEFTELAKWVIVKIAEQDLENKNEEPTYSRIAVVTGLTRQVVTQTSNAQLEELVENKKGNRAARILSNWLIDSEFLDEKGKPMVLSTGSQSQDSSFSRLVKKYGGDIPVKTVLEELISVGAIEFINRTDIRMITRGLTPDKNISELIKIVGRDTSDLLNTMNHNLSHEPEYRFFQKKVCHDGISSDELQAIRLMTKKKSQKLLEDIYKDLSKFGDQKNKRKENYETGIGVYYYERNLKEKSDEN
jgi:hypothetical protein